jgi:hypothetical protein
LQSLVGGHHCCPIDLVFSASLHYGMFCDEFTFGTGRPSPNSLQ